MYIYLCSIVPGGTLLGVSVLFCRMASLSRGEHGLGLCGKAMENFSQIEYVFGGWD